LVGEGLLTKRGTRVFFAKGKKDWKNKGKKSTPLRVQRGEKGTKGLRDH